MDRENKEIKTAVKDVADSGSFALPTQIVRAVSAILFLLVSSICINFTQLIGYPIKFISPNIYHAWIDLTKQSFGIYLTAANQLYTPAEVTITGDKSMQGKFTKDSDDNLFTHFGDKAVLISNHQLYVDWIYMWWIAFTAKTHGGIFIILKASLKWVPIWGWGMQFFRFIFLSRKWANDEKVLENGLQVIQNDKQWPTWLILFPEGTTMSKDGVSKTQVYGKKMDLEIPKHVMLPRSRGLRYSLLGLKGSKMEYLYDATIHYGGVPPGQYGEDYYTLKAMFLKGQYPKHLNIYWRRWAISEIPYEDEKEFEKWIQDRWYEKDELMDKFINEGKWSDEEEIEPLTVKVKLRSWIELLQVFSVPLNILLIGSLLYNHLLPLFQSL